VCFDARREEAGMKNNLHLDFSLDKEAVEVQDLITGQVYEANKNLLKRLCEDTFETEIKSKRQGIDLCSRQIKHWLARGWDAALPLYLSSRCIQYVDSGIDREQVLEKLFSNYLEEGACPKLTHKSNKLIQIELQTDLEKKSECFANCYEAMAKRKTRRSFGMLGLSRKKALSIFSDATLRISRTFDLTRTTSTEERHVISYGCAFNIYVIIYNINELPEGIYEIDAETATINLFREGCFRSEMNEINWGMKAALTANYTIVLTIRPDIYAWRYRHDRALRSLMIEAGRIMHEFVISAACFNVQGVVTPATADHKLSTLLQIDDTQELPFYTGTFGAVYREKDS